VSLPPRLVAALGDAVVAEVELDAPIGPLTTYRVGGSAAALVRAGSGDELRRVGLAVAAAEASDGPVPLLVLGRGSNLLVADRGFPGVAVVLTDGLAGVALDGTTATAGAATSLPVVARRTASAGLTGFEWAVGVPGSIGGAVRMNAGGHGSDMAASLRRVRVVDLRSGEDGWMPAAALQLGYRRSSLAARQVVVAAELGLAPGDREASMAELADIVRWRREHQPGGANAGSVFTNPEGDAAGRLLDEAGAKGRRRGSAVVSTKHANFVLADDGGSADDVAALMADVRALVLEGMGVDLHAETHLVGFTVEEATAAGARLLTGLDDPDRPRPEVEG
jgi:UDP-N-acetylmuramate dehydrogenase